MSARACALVVLLASAAGAAPDDPFEVFGQQKIATGSGGFAGALGPADAFGSSVAVLGDLDGNGVADLAVGAPNSSSPPGGAVWILFMEADDTVLMAARIDAATAAIALDANDQFGASLAALGDLDGDTQHELAVGAPNFGPGLFLGPGAVFVLSVSAAGLVLGVDTIAEGQAGMPGVPSATGFGVALANVGDLDLDGVPDLAVGDSVGGSAEEVVWLLRLQADSSVLGATSITPGLAVFGGQVLGGQGFGRALAGLGDLDGNGTPDLAVGEPGAGTLHAGAAWVLRLEATPAVLAATRIGEGQGGFAGPLEAQAGFGGALAAGNLDGDAQTELIVGASMSHAAAGGAWILGLDTAGMATVAEEVAEGLQGFAGPLEDFDQFASGVAILPDTGGALQLVGGARGDASTFLVGPGAVWVLDTEPADPWFQLGGSLAGSNGVPMLQGAGPLTDGSANSLDLTHGMVLGTANLVLGFTLFDVPFKGGVLVPAPDVLVPGLPLDGAGALSLGFTWPSGVPAGVRLYFQHWIADAAGPKGFSASNGLKAVTP